jgi:hypothetical protein
MTGTIFRKQKKPSPQCGENWVSPWLLRLCFSICIFDASTSTSFSSARARLIVRRCGVLSCLGLFGLSIYTAQRRTREIGIRKVMGASTGAVMRMLLRAFSEPVILGQSESLGRLAGWVMARWLEGFRLPRAIKLVIFPAATVLALGNHIGNRQRSQLMVARVASRQGSPSRVRERL